MSASEKIDIEEHDILNDPGIKRIFPDITVIKTESNQSCDEVSSWETPVPRDMCERDASNIASEAQLPNNSKNSNSTKESAPLEDLHQGEAITTEPEAQHHTRFQTSNEFSSFSTSKNSETQTASIDLQDHVTKLGSDIKLRFEPKLILDNVNTFLNTCKRYCKECLILFPSTHTFDLHMIKTHCKRNNRTTFKRSKVTDKMFKCNFCDSSLSSRFNLLRHLERFHPRVEALNAVDTKESKEQYCFHCQRLFSSHTALIEHLYDVMRTTQTGPSDRSKGSTDVKEPNEENLNEQLKDDFFKDFDESNVSYVNSRPCSSSQLNTDSCDVDEHIRPQAIHPRKRSLRSAVRLAEGGDDKKKEKRKANSDPLQDQPDNARKRLKSQDFKEQLNHSEKSDNKNTVSAETYYPKKEPSHSMFYKCFICSKYCVTFDCFCRHVLDDHRLKEIPKVEKVLFDAHCKFCKSINEGMKSYNTHLFKFHYKQLTGAYNPMVVLPEKNHFAFTSVLFKCTLCDLFFLSCHAAKDHSKHLGISDTWKCPLCQRKFKSECMALHEIQHSFSQSFTVHTLAETAFSQVLFKCSKCTVHYSEQNFVFHYGTCETETPNSSYCKVCDILMNRDDMECHIQSHEQKRVECCDFIIIESDIIDGKCTSKTKNQKSDTKHSKHNSMPIAKKKTDKVYLKKSKLSMSFCPTCKCFIYNTNMRKVHVQGKCGHMLKYVCVGCGLMLTTKTHETHKVYHSKKKITLQDFLFYDLKTKIRILPPIPDYPKCNSCGVHFLRTHDVRSHLCQKQDFITCNVCSMKLTKEAHILHVNFHSYYIPSVVSKLVKNTLPAGPANVIPRLEPNSSVSDDSYATNVKYYYTCKSCRLTVNTYDKAVQHCQDHYDSKVDLLYMQKCQNCSLTLLTSDFKNHKMMVHLTRTFNLGSIKVIDFDPFYFQYDNDFWTNHIFAYVPEDDSRKIIGNSIYRYECRFKMEKIQSGGSNSVLYKCDICHVFIDPQYLYTHAANNRGQSCAAMRKHPCSFCGQNFVPSAYRAAHEKEHENAIFNLRSYTIVLYNKKEHDTYTKIIIDGINRNVLYQCRNCERAVEKFERTAHKCDENNLKLCSACGLLLDKQYFDLHSSRHEELREFNGQDMIVVMFGKPKVCNEKRSLRSVFSGTKLDYIIYKCKKCNLCVKSKECISEHDCLLGNSKCKCSFCGLYFTELDLKCHCKVHESNLHFDNLNIHVITFDASSKITLVNSKQKSKGNNDLGKNTDSTSTSPKIHETLYKCNNCGLHFFEKQDVRQHVNICNARMKISKQICIKCDLLFSPAELFHHLQKHHADKTLQYIYDIILVGKEEN